MEVAKGWVALMVAGTAVAFEAVMARTVATGLRVGLMEAATVAVVEAKE